MWVVEQDIPLYWQVIIDVSYQLKKKRWAWGVMMDSKRTQTPS
jgi:hypothetical protein